MKYLIFISFLIFMLSNSFCQITVKGIVNDEKGEPMFLATVRVKGTKINTKTGIDGDYSIKVRNISDILLFSYVLYNTKEVRVGNDTIINVNMTSEESYSLPIIKTLFTDFIEPDIYYINFTTDFDRLYISKIRTARNNHRL